MGASWGWWLWLLMVAYCYSIVMLIYCCSQACPPLPPSRILVLHEPADDVEEREHVVLPHVSITVRAAATKILDVVEGLEVEPFVPQLRHVRGRLDVRRVHKRAALLPRARLNLADVQTQPLIAARVETPGFAILPSVPLIQLDPRLLRDPATPESKCIWAVAQRRDARR